VSRKKRVRDVQMAISREVEARGGNVDFKYLGSGHIGAVIQVGDRRMMYVMPGSPSDSRRGAINALSGVRRLLNAQG
jgi:hypothetical protein